MDAVTSTTCGECQGTGFCAGCRGDGLVLAAFTVDVCATCMGYGTVREGATRRWCPACGGNGRYLMYDELVPCQACVGDGACVPCLGSGQVPTGTPDTAA